MRETILLSFFGSFTVVFALGIFYLFKFFYQESKEKGIGEGYLKQANILTLMKNKENKYITNFGRMMLLAILLFIIMIFLANIMPINK